jgi:hypothetical protein
MEASAKGKLEGILLASQRRRAAASNDTADKVDLLRAKLKTGQAFTRPALGSTLGGATKAYQVKRLASPPPASPSLRHSSSEGSSLSKQAHGTGRTFSLEAMHPSDCVSIASTSDGWTEAIQAGDAEAFSRLILKAVDTTPWKQKKVLQSKAGKQASNLEIAQKALQDARALVEPPKMKVPQIPELTASCLLIDGRYHNTIAYCIVPTH